VGQLQGAAPCQFAAFADVSTHKLDEPAWRLYKHAARINLTWLTEARLLQRGQPFWHEQGRYDREVAWNPAHIHVIHEFIPHNGTEFHGVHPAIQFLPGIQR